jgi:hypothetical protein
MKVWQHLMVEELRWEEEGRHSVWSSGQFMTATWPQNRQYFWRSSQRDCASVNPGYRSLQISGFEPGAIPTGYHRTNDRWCMQRCPRWPDEGSRWIRSILPFTTTQDHGVNIVRWMRAWRCGSDGRLCGRRMMLSRILPSTFR